MSFIKELIEKTKKGLNLGQKLPKNIDEARQKEGWEQSTLEKLAFYSIQEQKTERKWRIFFRLTYLLIFLGIMLGLLRNPAHIDEQNPKKLTSKDEQHLAIVDLKGVITLDSEASSTKINESLDEAFENENSVAVVIKANSPGGSPVQSDLVSQHITLLKNKYPKKPLITVVEEMCASGCYYMVANSTQILANASSLVGSIGVLMDGFGFTGTMEKLGVERRLITAGKNKGFLDPFSPVSEEQKVFAKELLVGVHDEFKNVVKQGRGAKLQFDKIAEDDLFSGLVWHGRKAKEIGLIDDLGSLETLSAQYHGLKYVNYSNEESSFEKFAKKLGASIGFGFSTSLVNQFDAKNQQGLK
jgi:protease-4